MKHLFVALAIMGGLLACKKETTATKEEHIKSPYSVMVVGNGDTTIGSTMFARAETVGLIIVEDSKLKAVLTAYHKDENGNGVYDIEVTNKTNCQGIIRWHWEGLTIDKVRANRKDSTSDVIPANQIVTFTLTGDAKVGKIKLKTDFVGSCGNSSELIINITMAVLPFKLIENTAKYDELTGKVIVSFTIDDPSRAQWIIIRKMENGEWKQALLIGGDYKTRSYSIPL